MAAVLGWKECLPVAAPELRGAVLEGWGGVQERSLPFTEIRSMQPEAFVDLLASVLRVRAVVCGSNYRFGHRAAGDAALLKSLGQAAGLRVEVVDLVSSGRISGKTVSSTIVRESLADGEVRRASGLLGRPHATGYGGVVLATRCPIQATSLHVTAFTRSTWQLSDRLPRQPRLL